MKSKSIGLYVQGVLAGILLFLFASPYYMWEYQTLGYFLRLVYGVVLFLNYRKGNESLSILWAIFLLFISIAIGNSFIATFVFIFANIFLLSADTDFLRIAYKSLYLVFVFFAILSIINYILYLLGVAMPYHIIEPVNEAKLYDYTAYPFMVIANDITGTFRFHGLFDEAGALATYCFLFLWAERFALFTWKNFILMVAGFLSLSLFFYVAIGIIILIKFFSKGTKNFYRFLYICLIALFAYSLTIDDSVVSTAIVERLEYDDEKGFVGNNRSNEFLDMYYNRVRWSEPVFYLGPTLGGMDKDVLASRIGGASGYKQAILAHGLLGCVIYILFFFLYAKNNIKNRKDILLFVLCFLMTLYQRPFFTDVVYIFMFCWIIHSYIFKSDDSLEGKS